MMPEEDVNQHTKNPRSESMELPSMRTKILSVL